MISGKVFFPVSEYPKFNYRVLVIIHIHQLKQINMKKLILSFAVVLISVSAFAKSPVNLAIKAVTTTNYNLSKYVEESVTFIEAGSVSSLNKVVFQEDICFKFHRELVDLIWVVDNDGNVTNVIPVYKVTSEEIPCPPVK